MEMHQVRYFLAVARTLNFTRAAEECNVSQPALTRAIKQLEGELGGDLFRRERPQAQLTGLGERMHPLLRQCYDSALGARSLASLLRSGEIASLKVALSRTIDLGLLIPHLMELTKHFNGLELKFLRGTALEINQILKNGDAELALAAEIGEPWERLDRWPLFSESFLLMVNGNHRLANRMTVEIEDLRDERFLLRPYCEDAEQIAALLRGRDLDLRHGHEVASERDVIALIEANLGVAVVPRSAAAAAPATLMRAPINGLDLRRTVHLYGVAGRQRTAVAATFMKQLRAANWSRYMG